MISNQIIQEALIRLKRSGKNRIFLSEQSQTQLKNVCIADRANSTVKISNVIKEQSSDSIDQLNALRLSKDSKSENIITLKEALANFFPNEKLLFGKGSLDPKILFLSEYPNAEELQKNSLCVGKANELMGKIIKAMGVNKEDVYFTSVVKSKTLSTTLLQKGINCPESKGIKVFVEYFKKELSLVNPSIIISLGELAHSFLIEQNLEKNEFNPIRGKVLKFEEYPIISTYNPSYLLLKDSLESKRSFWEDLLLAMDELKLEISDKQKNYFKKH